MVTTLGRYDDPLRKQKLEKVFAGFKRNLLKLRVLDEWGSRTALYLCMKFGMDVTTTPIAIDDLLLWEVVVS